MNFRVIYIFAIMSVMLGCSVNFDEHYDKIDDKVRPISYEIWGRYPHSSEPYSSDWTETAPGDTALLYVFFTGKRITENDVKADNWKANWNIYTDEYGNLAPRGGDKKLEIIKEPYLRDTMGGQMVSIEFKIPDSVLYHADVIPNDLSDLEKIYPVGNIPQEFRTKKSALAFLEYLAENPLPYNLNQYAIIDGLAQIFSCMYEIYLDIPGVPRTKVRHTARYNRKIYFIGFGYLPSNLNPHLSYLYFYQGGKIGDGIVDDTIRISLDKSKSVYVDIAFPERADEFYTLEQAFSPNPKLSPETYGIRLFIEDVIYDKIRLESGNFINIAVYEAGESAEEKVIIDHGKAKVGDTGWIWCMVYDDRYGVANFPQGRRTYGFVVKFVE